MNSLAPAPDVPVTVFSAASVTGKRLLRNATYSGVPVPPRKQIRFRVENGVLTACLEDIIGMYFILR